MIKVTLVAAVSFFCMTGWAVGQAIPAKGILWLDPAVVQQRMADSAKPILIDVYTNWCQYCKIMDKTTWQHKQVAAYVAAHFYPIKFNAEYKEPVAWQGNTYTYKPAYKVHLLAAEWLMGNMVYPSTALLPPQGDPIVLPGVMTPAEIEPVLRYFAEGHYRTTAWKQYQAAFKPSWK